MENDELIRWQKQQQRDLARITKYNIQQLNGIYGTLKDTNSLDTRQHVLFSCWFDYWKSIQSLVECGD